MNHDFDMLFRYTAPPPTVQDRGLEKPSNENTVLFLVSCFQYILVAGAFSIGPPYRKSMWTNGTFQVLLQVELIRWVYRLAYVLHWAVVPD